MFFYIYVYDPFFINIYERCKVYVTSLFFHSNVHLFQHYLGRIDILTTFSLSANEHRLPLDLFTYLMFFSSLFCRFSHADPIFLCINFVFCNLFIIFKSFVYCLFFWIFYIGSYVFCK